MFICDWFNKRRVMKITRLRTAEADLWVLVIPCPCAAQVFTG